MAIFTSNLYANGGLPVQAASSGLGSITARVFIPAGTTLTDGDFIRIVRLSDNVPIHRITVRSADLDGGGSPALAASLGYERAVTNPRKAYNATTNPYLTGTTPGDDTDYFVTAGAGSLQAGGVVTYVSGQSALDNEFANTGLINGTVDLVYEVTTTANGASAAAGYIDVTVEYSGKLQVPGEFSGANVYDYQDNSSGI